MPAMHIRCCLDHHQPIRVTHIYAGTVPGWE